MKFLLTDMSGYHTHVLNNWSLPIISSVRIKGEKQKKMEATVLPGFQ